MSWSSTYQCTLTALETIFSLKRSYNSWVSVNVYEPYMLSVSQTTCTIGIPTWSISIDPGRISLDLRPNLLKLAASSKHGVIACRVCVPSWYTNLPLELYDWRLFWTSLPANGRTAAMLLHRYRLYNSIIKKLLHFNRGCCIVTDFSMSSKMANSLIWSILSKQLLISTLTK